MQILHNLFQVRNGVSTSYTPCSLNKNYACVKGFFTYIPSFININIGTWFLTLTTVMVGHTYHNPNPNPSAPLKQVMDPLKNMHA